MKLLQLWDAIIAYIFIQQWSKVTKGVKNLCLEKIQLSTDSKDCFGSIFMKMKLFKKEYHIVKSLRVETWRRKQPFDQFIKQ